MKIKAIITGSTGMVGKGVLLECLESPEVESVLVINRHTVGIKHDKLKEIIHKDFHNITPIKDSLKDYSACFFCLGVSSAGISKEDYYKRTYDLTIHFAKTVLEENPEIIFCYVSGQGTNSAENSRMAWANVKGKTENALLAMPFKSAYMFRPGFIQPMKGVKSATPLYNTLYALSNPLYPLLKSLFPKAITSTVQVGKAMINIVVKGYDKLHLENEDINKLAK